jgi:predicted Zn-dependent protease with MMP-like domain
LDPIVPSTETWEEWLSAAREAWGEERPHDALQLCDRAAQIPGDARYQAALLRGDILLEMGDAAGALSSYDSVADPSTPDAELDCARGLALFELARMAEAENALRSALRGNDKLADAHYALGLIAELHGNGQETEHFRRARRIAPERFPASPKRGSEDFQELVEEALEGLPPHVKGAMEEIPVLVAEVPHPEDLRQCDPPVSPLAFGMMVGLASQTGGYLEDDEEAQPGLLLFKRNLERACHERQSLVDEIRATVIQEAEEHLGLMPGDEDEVGSEAETGNDDKEDN